MTRTKTPTYAEAVEQWARAAASSDNAWGAYRKARERVARQRVRDGRASFGAEQAFIDAGQAVARADERVEARLEALCSACFDRARSDLALEARARLQPPPSMMSPQVGLRADELLRAALN